MNYPSVLATFTATTKEKERETNIGRRMFRGGKRNFHFRRGTSRSNTTKKI